jgi:CheY-specific phosphatase CheX
MRETLDQPLYAAAAAAFEAFAFVYAEPTEPNLGADAFEDAAAAVDFEGPMRGRLVLRVSGGVLPNLAATMLGQDDPPATPLQRDALGEVANVICGALLPTLGGPSAVFALARPTVDTPWDRLVQAEGTPVAVASLDLDGGRADVVCYLH